MIVDEYKELFARQLGRIEELARRLMDRKFESARDLWAIQTNLAQLQIEIREEITIQTSLAVEVNKKIVDIAKSRKEGWKESLQELQAKVKYYETCVDIHKRALMLAKQFGDALAWLFLNENEKRLSSLMINHPNPPIPTGVSLQAMLTVAESYANAGAGFPIIHDITNCLRVGDLTFVDPHNDDDEPLTIEVKARAPRIENGKLKSQVEVYAVAYSPKFVAASAKLQSLAVED